MNDKPWSGRFTQPTDRFVEAFSASIAFDSRLYREDIAGSVAHCRMLARQGVLPGEEAQRIIAGLEQVRGELDRGELPFQDSLEDIHMHVETRLKELIGPVAGKLHTARSRNDQVATDLRLWLRRRVDEIQRGIILLQGNLLDLAEQEVETILPGFTHLQIAQPVSLGHHLLAYVEMLHRDAERFEQVRGRINQLPLGAAALAGTPYPIDRESVAGELGFEGVCANSIDAVSDRDFAMESVFAASLVMVHLSRFAEELILWCSPLFGFIELGDAFCTGSSIMPQKKNPDVPELVRGKSGRVIGSLMSLLTLMKGLPLAYNRDMQEDKQPLFDAMDTVLDCLRAFTDLVPAIHVKRERMLHSARMGYATATDLADYLVGKGIPFREAHAITGKLVQQAWEQGIGLDELPLEAMQAVDGRIAADVKASLTVLNSVNAREAFGGTAFATVREALVEAKMLVNLRLLGSQ
ncbi:MAG: argininosuccinate lyase [Magnetococcales bacterium]|nr:argininosuccinate lyase [Magnetococcales bacterium]